MIKTFYKAAKNLKRISIERYNKEIEEAEVERG
jgi:hypothetical protein